MGLITSYEKQYMDILMKIYHDGYEDGINKRTGLSTKRLPGQIIRVDVEKEFPILKSKFVAGKTALREILWIWQQMSNNIHDLKAKIWDEWADETGSIGKAYGAQIAKPVCIYTDPVNKKAFRAYENQTQFVLEYLREFPTGRWANVTLWNVDDLSAMRLVPCCHTTTWNLDGGRLNCVLNQRSGDIPYGVPFNTTQYAELMILFARDLGVKPGILTHVIADAHIYENQMEGVETQIQNYMLLCSAEIGSRRKVLTLKYLKAFADDDKTSVKIKDDFDLINDTINCNPKFVVNSESTSFWDVKPEDCIVDDYKNLGKISFGDIAV